LVATRALSAVIEVDMVNIVSERACVREVRIRIIRRRDSMRGGRSRGGHDESRTVDDDFRSFSTSKKRAARKDARVRRSIARSIARAIDARARSNFERRAAMDAAMDARVERCGCARG
jgi:hypothetical protein